MTSSRDLPSDNSHTSFPGSKNGERNSDSRPAHTVNLDNVVRSRSEDEFADVLAENWKTVAGALVIVLLGTWVWHTMKEKREQVLGDASSRFDNVQDGYSTYVIPLEATDKVAGADQIRGFHDTISVLKDSYSETPYSHFAGLYSAATELAAGNAVKARALLAETSNPEKALSGVPEWEDKKIRSNEVYEELSLLLFARVQLSLNEPGARESLTRLAKRGKFAYGEALLAILRSSKTPEERKEAIALAEEVLVHRPEARKTLQSELLKFGVAGAEKE